MAPPLQRRRVSRARSTNWCMTFNNPTMATSDNFRSLVNDNMIRYIKFQYERGDGTDGIPIGTPHYQVYAQSLKRLTMPQMKTAMRENGIHVEIRKGTHEEADDYCEKEESRFVGPVPLGFLTSGCFGDPIFKKGQRTDLDAIKKDIDEGMDELTTWDTHFTASVRNYKAFNHYRNLKLCLPRNHQTKVLVLFGETDLGKSHRAFNLHPDFFVYNKKEGATQQWFDGYTGQETLIIEEMEGATMAMSFMRRLADKYPMKVPTKGAFVEFRPKLIIFTSNRDPRHWWYKANGGKFSPEDLRRFSTPIGRVCRVLRRYTSEDEDPLYDGTEDVDVSLPIGPPPYRGPPLAPIVNADVDV